MIISHSLKFIYIKNYKVAGSSIEAYLSRFCDTNDIVLLNSKKTFLTQTRLDANNTPLPKPIELGVHATAVQIREVCGTEIWQTYFKFCFERDPVDKAISAFYFEHKQLNQEFSADEWMRQRAAQYGSNFWRYSEAGKPLTDFIGRYENLSEDLVKVCNHIGIPFDGVLREQKKTGIRPKLSDSSSVFSPYQRLCIIAEHRQESELLGYPELPSWLQAIIRKCDIYRLRARLYRLRARFLYVVKKIRTSWHLK